MCTHVYVCVRACVCVSVRIKRNGLREKDKGAYKARAGQDTNLKGGGEGEIQRPKE